MYAEFFGLRQDPFSIAPDPRYLFMSERHREALAHLLYGIRGGGGFVLLSGEIGAGKTTICRCFLEQVPAQCKVAYIFNPKLTVGDLLRTICSEFHIEVRHEGMGPATVKDHLDPLNAYLLASHARGERNVLIIDEAQNLTPHVLEQLRLLTNLETSERKLLQIILIGQPELRGVLARPELEQLAQRVIARFHLDALDAAETRQYIQHRMNVAGLKGPVPFSPAALDRIHELSRGVPRRINLLCDRSLLGAYASGQNRVEQPVVDKAAAEVFDLATPSSPPLRPRPAGAAPQRGLGPLGLGAVAGAVVGALVAGAVVWFWSQRMAATPQAAAGSPGTSQVAPPVASAVTSPVAPPDAAAPAVPANAPPVVAAESAPAAPVPADVATRPEPLPGLPGAGDLLASEDAAWRELLPLWGMAVADGGDPCAQALGERLQCYRTTRMTMHGLRQLDRPGVLSLRLREGSGRVLLTALHDDGAVLQIGERRWRMPLADLSAAWRGDYATVWRQPPGQQGRLSDGRTGAASRWLDERIAQLQVAGSVPASAATPGARLQAFQRAQGIDADGPAGPVTFMQINLASGVDEPRLLAPRS